MRCARTITRPRQRNSSAGRARRRRSPVSNRADVRVRQRLSAGQGAGHRLVPEVGGSEQHRRAHELGVIYANGDGVKKDDAEAVTWFQKAADARQSVGAVQPGTDVRQGSGVKVDNAQAIAWWRKSAAQGFAARSSSWASPTKTAKASTSIPSRARQLRDRRARRQQGVPRIPRRHREAAHARTKAGRPCVGRRVDGRPADAVECRRAGAASSAPRLGAPVKNRCSATGSMGGEKFAADQLCRVAIRRSAQCRDLVQRRPDHAAGSRDLPDLVVRRRREGRQAAHDGDRSCSARAEARRWPSRLRSNRSTSTRTTRSRRWRACSRCSIRQGLQGREDDR